MEFAHAIAESSLTVDHGVNCQRHNRYEQAIRQSARFLNERRLRLPEAMKHRMALPTNTTTLKVIKTVDSTTVVGLFLDLNCPCKMANTSTLLSLGSMLFVTQTKAARNLSLCRQPTAYFLL